MAAAATVGEVAERCVHRVQWRKRPEGGRETDGRRAGDGRAGGGRRVVVGGDGKRGGFAKWQTSRRGRGLQSVR